MIFIILILILLVISILLITKKFINNSSNSSWKKEHILNLYNNSESFDKNGLPNGGILVSLLSNSYASGINIGTNTIENNLDYPNSSYCYKKDDIDVPDLTDLNKLLLDTAHKNLTNCFSLDTTYMSFDAPGVLFGPLLDNKGAIINMSIGLILDINKLKKYIGCMFLADSGSIDRYNTEPSPDYLQTTDLEDYDSLIRSKKGKALADAGCGLMNGIQYGKNRGGIFNEPGYLKQFKNSSDKNYYPYARYTHKADGSASNNSDYLVYPEFNYETSPGIIKSVVGKDTLPVGVLIDKDYNLLDKQYKTVDIFTYPNGWFNENRYNGNPSKITYNSKESNLNMFMSGTYGIMAQPYSRKSFKYFTNQIKQKYKSIFQVYGDNNLGKFFTNTYYANIYKINNPYNMHKHGYTNFYYENEVDIYVPNKEGTTKSSAKKVDKCNVSDDFLKIWKECVIGIFTNHRCSEDIRGSSFQTKYVRNTIDFNTNDDFNSQVGSKIGPGKNEYLGKPECTDEKPCCCSNNNYEILDEIVIKLVKKWNKNNVGYPKINGYIMNDDMKLDGDTPPDFNTKNITKPLKIKQITNY